MRTVVRSVDDKLMHEWMMVDGVGRESMASALGLLLGRSGRVQGEGPGFRAAFWRHGMAERAQRRSQDRPWELLGIGEGRQ